MRSVQQSHKIMAWFIILLSEQSSSGALIFMALMSQSSQISTHQHARAWVDQEEMHFFQKNKKIRPKEGDNYNF